MAKRKKYSGEKLVARLSFIAHQYRRHCVEALRQHDLTEDDLYCLREASVGALPVCELVKQLKLPRYRVTRLRQKLRGRGLLKVHLLTKDRRRLYIKATSKAVELIAEVDEHVRRSLAGATRRRGVLDQSWSEEDLVRRLDEVIELILARLWQSDGWYGEALREEEARKRTERAASRSNDNDINF